MWTSRLRVTAMLLAWTVVILGYPNVAPVAHSASGAAFGPEATPAFLWLDQHAADRPPGDSGRIVVTWGQDVYWATPADLNLDDGVLAAPGTADLQVTADGLRAPHGLQQPETSDFGGLVAFHTSGFAAQAPARLGAVYLVRTASGRYAKVQVIPGNRVRVAVQQGEGRRLNPGEVPGGEGLRFWSATVPDHRTGEGIDLRSGEVVAANRADLVLGATGSNLTLNATGGIVDLGPVYIDRISEAPEGTAYRNFVAAKRNHTYAVRTRSGHYGLVFVADLDATPVAYVEVGYQSSGGRSFFPHVDPVPSGIAQPTTQNQGSVIRGGAGASAPPPLPVPTATATGLPPTPPVESPPRTDVEVGAPPGIGQLTADPGDGQVLLRWLLPRPPGETGLVGFFIFRGTEPGALRQLNSQPVKATEYHDRSARNDITYYYHVLPMWTNDELGEPSETRAATPRLGAPDPAVVAGDPPAVSEGQLTAVAQSSSEPGAGMEIRLWIAGQDAVVGGQRHRLPVPPFIRANRTLIPLRFIAEALGAQVGWQEVDRRILIRLGSSTVELWLDRPVATVNGVDMQLEVSPALEDGHTVVPLRLVVEAFGAEVSWDPGDGSIRIQGRP